MRRSFTALSAALCLLAGSAVGQIFNNNYYFSPNSQPTYNDLTTVKATELVNPKEIITVGFTREPGSTFAHNINLTKVRSTDGRVIWSREYGLTGLDERAYGLTPSVDGKHVIVVGTAQNQELTTDFNAFAMKVNIATGAVVWAAEYGEKDSREEARMIELNTSSIISPQLGNYFVVGTSSVEGQLKAVLYALNINDNATLNWSNRYFDAVATEAVNDLPFTMVRNPDRNFIIAGNRFENSRPARIFTVGINPGTGVLTDKYVYYDIDGRNLLEGSICTIKADDEVGYGLTFTTRDPGITNVTTAITVIRTNKDRKPLWTNYYFQEGHNLNSGLSIYQSREDGRLLDVYTNTVRSTNNPGFLNIRVSDGSLNYFLKYNKEEFNNNKFATAMVQRRDGGYTAKALHRDGEVGFMLASLANNGKTECAKEEKIERKKPETKGDSREYKPKEHGKPIKREIKEKQVFGKAERCDGTGGYSFKLAGGNRLFEAAETTSFNLFPNPITTTDEFLTLSYEAPEATVVTIRVVNALGQPVHLEQVTLNAGTNALLIEAAGLATGLNLVTIHANDEVLYRHTVVKQ